ncbi:hypothetical protein GBF38_002284 [Nibea albiflora]|uniref:Uncharacterized protein n=1 Tax=Nibea albiflora TaxID=240163 RepID=A0ACB7EES3_NIBAL|nr:hypothetical protein GBF38_002284 [Nibea albiflora]
MGLWIIFPVSLSLVSFIGTWSVYGLAFSNNHVCSLSDWGGHSYCTGNQSNGCCFAPTISASGSFAPENSLFTATINAGSFLFLLFCTFHHAHIMERHACHSMLSKFALVFGVVAALGAFAAGNCNEEYYYLHLSAVVEWMLSVNLELFELSYAVEFWFFSSFMISNLLGKREEEKPLMMTMS